MTVFFSSRKEQPTLFDNDRSFEKQINCAICMEPPFKDNKLVVSPCGHFFCAECKVSQIAIECIELIVKEFTDPEALLPGVRILKCLSSNINDDCALCREPSLLNLYNDSDLNDLVESWEKLPADQRPKISLTELLEQEKGVFYDLWEKEEKKSDITLLDLVKKRLEVETLPLSFNASRIVSYSNQVESLQANFSAFLIDLELGMRSSDQTKREGLLNLIEQLVKTKLGLAGVPNEGHQIQVTFDIQRDHSTDKQVLNRVTGAAKKQIRKDLLPCLIASVIIWYGLKYMRIKRIGLVAQILAAYVSSYALDHLAEGVYCSNKYKWPGIFVVSTFIGLHYLPLKVSLAFSTCLASYHVMKPKDNFF